MKSPYPLKIGRLLLVAAGLLCTGAVHSLSGAAVPPPTKTGELIMSEKSRPLFAMGRNVFFDEGGSHRGLSAAALVWPVDIPEVQHKANSVIGRIALLQYAPGGGRKVGSIPSFREQTFYVISGKARFTLGKDRKEVGPGEFVFIPDKLAHGYEVIGDAPLKMLTAVWRNGDVSEPKPYKAVVTSEKVQPLIRISKEAAGNHKGISVSFWVSYYGFEPLAIAPNSQATWLTLQEFDPDPTVIATNVHSHLDQEQAFYVLDGKGRFTAGELKQEVGPTELVYAPRHVMHGYEVVGTTPLRFLMMSWKTK